METLCEIQVKPVTKIISTTNRDSKQNNRNIIEIHPNLFLKGLDKEIPESIWNFGYEYARNKGDALPYLEMVKIKEIPEDNITGFNRRKFFRGMSSNTFRKAKIVNGKEVLPAQRVNFFAFYVVEENIR